MKNLAIVAAAIAVIVVPSSSALAQGAVQAKPGMAQPGMIRPGMKPGGQMMGADYQKKMAERAKQRRAKLVKDLKLNAAQAKQYDALEKKMTDKRKKAFSKPGPMDMQAMQKTFSAMRKEQMDGMKKILTKDQFAKYTKMQGEERKKRMQGGMMGRPMPGQPMPGRPGMMPGMPPKKGN